MEEETEDEEDDDDEEGVEEEEEEKEHETDIEESSVDGDSEFEMDKLDCNLMATSLAGGIRGIKLSETWTAGLPQFANPVEDQHRCRDLTVQDTEAEDQAHTRDKERCIITGTGGPLNITHIYPPSLIPHTESTSMVGFWSVLKCFWPRKKVNSWKGAVLDQKGTESLANMLTLSPTVRKQWEKCYLALKPIIISKKRRRLTLEFHWL
ncbi:uncharacterized protein ASPGLDRAFT_1346842 [Aspergillus glaucus CBS 516.65]|uniref:HNH nuclease domain-containing protein n=1 Tax=Aspergillus glaucus CBS 516.65 TaxID=1160497 RepID=A0A1L9VN98_ASPGL|nr:hypothetical protein ASPGLDRAFT_1346842 [Aspergillus glaucus CBS 516.65]OJJ85395.1 hypothetical protein ASPGLDRAFT_1346842 [Aspergillus glaucus CBS 516.65]